ncbi:hypothetical protein L484_006563 [Morus notabilis]|uniref:Uncharacterized protein n=1 Tax=Morus notabilis TaxID=981085 RepID=W9S803_9ROSA|nr:hypothetical protein L484_006563 [Morus notabilis]
MSSLLHCRISSLFNSNSDLLVAVDARPTYVVVVARPKDLADPHRKTLCPPIKTRRSLSVTSHPCLSPSSRNLKHPFTIPASRREKIEKEIRL